MSKVVFEKERRYATEHRDSTEEAWTQTGFYESEAEAVRESEVSVWRYARVVYLGDNEEEK